MRIFHYGVHTWIWYVYCCCWYRIKVIYEPEIEEDVYFLYVIVLNTFFQTSNLVRLNKAREYDLINNKNRSNFVAMHSDRSVNVIRTVLSICECKFGVEVGSDMSITFIAVLRYYKG